MKNHKEILDYFGEKIIKECLDGSIKHVISLRNKENPPPLFKEKSDFLKELNGEQFENLKKILRGNFEIILFELFKILQENEQFKLYYENEGQKVDLVKISEDLKAEPIIENGWIDRFSKEFKNKK